MKKLQTNLPLLDATQAQDCIWQGSQQTFLSEMQCRILMHNNLQIGIDKFSVSSYHQILSVFGEAPFPSI